MSRAPAARLPAPSISASSSSRRSAAPGPSRQRPKVAISSTLREQRITGTALGRSTKTTGDEPGACRPVTGTEYLSSEAL